MQLLIAIRQNLIEKASFLHSTRLKLTCNILNGNCRRKNIWPNHDRLKLAIGLKIQQGAKSLTSLQKLIQSLTHTQRSTRARLLKVAALRSAKRHLFSYSLVVKFAPFKIHSRIFASLRWTCKKTTHTVREGRVAKTSRKGFWCATAAGGRYCRRGASARG